MEQLEQSPNSLSKAELLRNVQRLTTVIMDRLEKGSRENRLDAKQTRFLGSIALRAMRLWNGNLKGTGEPDPRLLRELDGLGRVLLKAFRQDSEVTKN